MLRAMWGWRAILKAIAGALGVALLAPMWAVAEEPAKKEQTLSLEECLKVARERNHRRPASQFAIQMAEAQHRQALAGYWPQVKAQAGVTRMDESPNFLFPASQMYIPAQSISVPGGSTMVTIPANAFGPGFPPQTIQMPVSFPGQTVNTPVQIFPVPEYNVKVMDPTTGTVKGGFDWLLFDGGMRAGYRQQARGAIGAAKAEQRRTDLELTDNVTRLYYGTVLARQLHQLGKDTLARMEVTLELTETLYKGGSEKVNKVDYLDNKVMVETMRTIVAELERNEASASSALAYTMGLEWNQTVYPASEEIPFQPFAGKLDELVATAYQFNPDWAKLEAGLTAYEGALKTAKSGYYPKIALTGELHRWWNGADSGLSTAANRTGWTIGGGLEWNVFDGFLTAGRVAEARARLAKLKEEKFLLKEGLGLQLKTLFLSLDAALKFHQAAERAMTAAKENRELTSRAYESGLIETERVIRAQLMESLMSAQFYKARFDRISLESQVGVVVGSEIGRQLNQAAK